MLQGAPPGFSGAPHPSRWMTRENFIKYLQHFQKHTTSNPDNKQLVLLDNHDSHVNIEATVFGPLKTYYNCAASDWMTNHHGGKNISLYDIPGLLGEAYPKTMTPTNIINGVRVSGIFPFNSNIFQDHEFCSSLVTDRPNPVEEIPERLATERIPSPQPGPSRQNDQLSIENPSSTIFVSPMDDRPFPKAPPRVNVQTKSLKRG